MNGILAKVGVEQLILIVLALAAVLAVLADLGGVFWSAWLGLASGCPLVLKCCHRRLAAGVD